MKPNLNPTALAVLAAIATLGGGTMTYLVYGKYTDSQARLTDLRNRTRDSKAIERRLAESVQKLAQSSQQLQHLEQGVPEIAYVPTLLTELERTGKESGIQVLGVRPMPADKNAKEPKGNNKKLYQNLDIEVKGRGKYNAILSFVQALKRFPKIAEVRFMTLQPKAELNQVGPPNIDVTAQLRVYLFPADALPTKGLTAQGGTSNAIG